MSQRNRFTKNIITSFLQMFSGISFQTVTYYISGYAYALLLGPSIYGIWQTAKVIIDYQGVYAFSLPFVMRRDFVMLRGEGKQKEALDIAHQVFSYLLAVTPVIALGIIIYSYYKIDNNLLKLTLFTVAAIYLFNIIIGYGNILTKGINDYKTLAYSSVILGVSSILSIPLVYYHGYYMLLVTVFITNAILAVYFYVKRPIEYKWFWNNSLLKTLIITAFPLYLAEISTAVFSSIDRIVIATVLTFKDVGLYSLSSMIATPLTILVSSAGIVLFTHLNERYGSSIDPTVIIKHSKIPQEILTWLLPPFIGMGIIVLPLLTKILLPKYQEGILAAQISVIGVLFYSLAGFTTNALFVLNKQKISALCFFIAGLIKTTGSYLTLKMGYGIAGVAASTVIAYYIYDTMLMLFVYKYIKLSKKEVIKILFDKLLPSIVVVLYCIIIITYPNMYFSIVKTKNAWVNCLMAEIVLIIISIPIIRKGIQRIKPYLL